MPGALDQGARQVAEELIEEFGRTVVYTRTTETYNSSTMQTDTTTATNDVLVSPPLDVRHTNLLRADPGQVLIQTGDAVVYLAAKGAPITPDTAGENDHDSIDIDGVEWKVVAAPPIYSGEKIAAYELILRRAGQ